MTRCLKAKDVEGATEYKSALEARQRDEAKKRHEKGATWQTKVGGGVGEGGDLADEGGWGSGGRGRLGRRRWVGSGGRGRLGRRRWVGGWGKGATWQTKVGGVGGSLIELLNNIQLAATSRNWFHCFESVNTIAVIGVL